MFTDNIKKLRKEKKLTQKQLAAMAGISASYLQQLELGQKENPSIDVLKNIATALGVPVNNLIGYFNKDLFAELVMNIKGSRTIEVYALDCGLDPDYILSIIKQKLDESPTPETIKKLVNNVPNGHSIDYLDLSFAAGLTDFDVARDIRRKGNNATPASVTAWSSGTDDHENEIEIITKKDNELLITVKFFDETFTQGDVNSIIDFIASLHHKKKMKIKYSSVLKEDENEK